MLVYILALGSPTHPVEPGCLGSVDAHLRQVWGVFQGQEYLSVRAACSATSTRHVWIDFRGIQDDYMRERGIDYFENSRRATLRAARVCDRQPDGLEGLRRERLGPDRQRRPAAAPRRITAASSASSATIARAAPACATNFDDGTIAPDRGGRLDRVRAGDRDPGDRGDARALRRGPLLELRLPGCVQSELRLRHRR